MISYSENDWNGFKRLDFVCEGHPGCLILPHTPLRPGNRWIWRTEFLGAFDSVDKDLLAKGWCLANFQISDMYGCPQAVTWMEAFRRLVVSEWSLCEKTVLEGFSRGGLYACNYALAYPERVSCLYLDAAVLDIRSWPGGYGPSPRAPREWEDCKRWYGLTEETAPAFDGNPIDHADTLCRAGIPLVLVAGLADSAVPYEHNGQKLADAYQRLGGQSKVILKENCDHHPHSLENPEPISSFIDSVTA